MSGEGSKNASFHMVLSIQEFVLQIKISQVGTLPSAQSRRRGDDSVSKNKQQAVWTTRKGGCWWNRHWGSEKRLEGVNYSV